MTGVQTCALPIYEVYLQRIIDLAGNVKNPSTSTIYPITINTPTKRALYDNVGKNEVLTNELDSKILVAKRDDWRDHPQRLKRMKLAIEEALATAGITGDSDIQRIFDLVKNQQAY